MRNKASGFLKQIISVITAMVKAKTLALKSKTRNIKTRLIIFSLLRNKKILLSSISNKLRTLMGQQQDHDDDHDRRHDKKDDEQNGAAVVVVHNNAMSRETLPNLTYTEFAAGEQEEEEEEEEGNEKKYPDLRHSLFELEIEDPGGSVIELVKNSKPEGEEFILEDEIDEVADLFIQRFHRQMMIQKQLSFKRYQEMLQS